MKKAFLLLLFCLFSVLVKAEMETIPSTYTNDVSVEPVWKGSGAYPGPYSSAAEACAAYGAGLAKIGTVQSGPTIAFTGIEKANLSCSFRVDNSNYSWNFSFGCPAGSTRVAVSGVATCKKPGGYTCPNSSWTLSADQKTCTRAACLPPNHRFPDGTCGQCPEGYNKLNDGSCVKCEDDTVFRQDLQMCVAPCYERSLQPPTKSSLYLGKGFPDRVPPYVCWDACQYVPVANPDDLMARGFLCNKAIPAGQTETPWCDWVTSGYFKANGARCTITPGIQPVPGGNENEQKPPESLGDQAAKCVAKGQGFGTVNGVIVCTGKEGVAADNRESSSSSENKSSEKTETKDKDGNVTDSTSKDNDSKTETKCTGDNCTSTTTSTGTGSDGSKTETQDKVTCIGENCTRETTTKTTDKDGNTTTKTENASQDKSTFCQQNPNHDLCSGKGDSKEPDFSIPTKGKFDGKTSEIEALQAQFSSKVNEIKNNLSGMFGTLSTGAGSLPCGEHFNVLGQSINFCFSQYNDKLSIIGVVIVLVAWIIAAGIVLWR